MLFVFVFDAISKVAEMIEKIYGERIYPQTLSNERIMDASPTDIRFAENIQTVILSITVIEKQDTHRIASALICSQVSKIIHHTPEDTNKATVSP